MSLTSASALFVYGLLLTQTHIKHSNVCIRACVRVSVSRVVMSKQGLDWLILPRTAHSQFSEHRTGVAKSLIMLV